MKRGKPPQRKTYIKRSTKRIKVRRGDPAKRRWARHRDAAFQGWIREQPCVLLRNPRNMGCDGPIECCHVRARGVGGADVGNCFAACRRHHQCQHLWGIKTFQEYFSVDLTSIAEGLGREYLEFAA